MINIRGGVLVGIALMAVASTAGASMVVYSDKAAFLAASGAVDATGPLPGSGFIGTVGGAPPGPVTMVGSIGFQAVRIQLADWSSRLPGNELAISYGALGLAKEDLNLLPAGPVVALGFDFVEPQSDPQVNAPFVDSTFTVTLKSGTTTIFTFTFNAPNDTAAFVGVAGDTPFDRVEIRETIGDDENEFFGRVYTRAAPTTAAVPEPATVLLLATGLFGLAGRGALRARGRGRSVRSEPGDTEALG